MAFSVAVSPDSYMVKLAPLAAPRLIRNWSPAFFTLMPKWFRAMTCGLTVRLPNLQPLVFGKTKLGKTDDKEPISKIAERVFS